MKNKSLLIALVSVAAVSLVLLVAGAILIHHGLLPGLMASQPATEPETYWTDPPTDPPTEPLPDPVYYTLTFAGDCTLGNQKGRVGPETFFGTVGKNYAHPFADVQDYFATDDCTFINLEVPLTDGGTPQNKQFVFRGPSDYINILTMGSVEFANVANNHAYDYGEEGYKDTKDLLLHNGIRFAEDRNTTLFVTESGLIIGVYAALYPGDDTERMQEAVAGLQARGAEVIVVAVHWGIEYHYQPNETQINYAYAAIDAGADIVYGTHPHILQKIEQYKDGMIYYSLGNFSFGGNMSPPDKDTAVLQQQVIRQSDGTVVLGELTIIPCYVSGILTYGNDFQPTPIPKDSTAYKRVLTKLEGKFHIDILDVPYRPDLKQ